MQRCLKWIFAGVCLANLGLASATFAGPQHWGFGFGYLVTVEQDERGRRALSVCEPPLRVKDGAWLLRWRDTSAQYKDVIPGGVAAGDLLGRGADQLITVHDEGSGRHLPAIRVPAPSKEPGQPWSVVGKLDLDAVAKTDAILGLAAGDFWGTGHDLLAVAPPRANGQIMLAVSDAAQRRVLEMPYAPDARVTATTLKEATGTFVGHAALEGPTEVAYTLDNGELRLAVDGHDRVARLR